jgi:predicted transcriptional regulator of viral defense system
MHVKTTDFNEFLSDRRIIVFTVNDAAKIIGKSKAYASKFLARDRAVKRAEKGLYYSGDASEYDIASNIMVPSYVSLSSALAYYNMTTQMPKFIYVISSRQHREIKNINGYIIVFKKAVAGMFYGYVKNGAGFIAEPEKAIIDCLYFRMESYAAEAMENNKSINAKKVAAYALRSGSGTVISRAGLLLDENGYQEEARQLYKRRSRMYRKLTASASAMERKWGIAHD